MELTAKAKKHVDELIELVDHEVLDAPPEAVAAFTRSLTSRAPLEFFGTRPLDQIAADVRDLYSLVAETSPDSIGARVRQVPDRHHRAIVATVMPDCPFIVDTLREYLHSVGFNVVQLLHPVLVVDRDRKGRIFQIRDRRGDGPKISVVYIVIDGHFDEERRIALESEIRERLKLVRDVTTDFHAMLDQCNDVIADLQAEEERFPWRAGEFEEIADLLRWLEDGCFVFLGYRAYDLFTDHEGARLIQVEPGSGLGVLRDESTSRYFEPQPLTELDAKLRARILGGPMLISSKANAESPVHRRARMDDISIKRLGPNGEVEGERRFLGLFTAKAVSQDASNIPIMRRKLREILEAESASEGSHDYGLIIRVFNSMPKEEVFFASVPELLSEIRVVMETEGVDEVRVTVRPDPLGRGVFVMVILPKIRFSGEVRMKIEEALIDAYQGTILADHLALIAEGEQARLHYYLSSRLKDLSEVDVVALEERIRATARSWEDKLSDSLARELDPERAHDLVDRHRDDFSAQYMATVDTDTAVQDLVHLDALEDTGVQQVVIEEFDDPSSNSALLKIYAPRGLFVLSDVMPTLENLGFRVIEADALEMGQAGASGRSTIHRFRVEFPAEWEIDREEVEPRVASALLAIQTGQTDDDPFNSLVLSAGLSWRQVAVLRAYAGYAFQIGAVTSRAGARRPLTDHPQSSRLLYQAFETRFDPELGDSTRRSKQRRLISKYLDSLDVVRSIEDDRTCRRLLELVRATTRTNFFQEQVREAGEAAIALKFDCGRLDFIPRPRPKFEIYVRSANTEGAHLRMDSVARGGIRWSDRIDDYRLEVLGLVKTQQVKNAVIVPAGSKGAFIVRHPPSAKAALRDAGLASYREFISALLDVTDTVRAGEVVHPDGVRAVDGEDPYLVVAADKGTAKNSDVANALAAEYEFWLGDAFASGGSRGYDHKELGITARGAWESVKRHFREMGTDIQSEEFTVVGIGDMSGDVFGNGMLLSRTIRLLAAFDHRHIFIDPDPDAETSWQERKRLFDMSSSSWEDYDTSLISQGGGVFERGAKSLSLSPEIRQLLLIEEEEINGEALVRAVLSAPADLLWNGGIGTYVRASQETDADVGDSGNDTVRISSPELRVKVIGEGGNLGLTQKARIEYAIGGGRLNTDALDNSAGVDMSDHEVNLKILLDAAVDQGELDVAERNRLLQGATDQVVEDVLQDNYLQSLAVSLDRQRARNLPVEFRYALTVLEREGVLDRQLEDLPTAEQLVEREELGQSLARPELAVILAYSKMQLKRAVADSKLPEDPATFDLVASYFPETIVAAVGDERLAQHRLRPRIIAAGLANLIVDRLGATGHLRLVQESGATLADVARATYVAYRVGDARSLYERLEALDGVVTAGLQLQWLLSVGDTLERTARWILSNADEAASIDEVVSSLLEPVRELRSEFASLLTETSRASLDNRRAMHEMDGLESELASDLVTFEYLDSLLPVAQLARASGLPASLAGEVYFGLTDEIDFPWLQEQLAALPEADLWQQRAVQLLGVELDSARARMAAAILRQIGSADDIETARADFRQRFAQDLSRIREVVDEIRQTEQPGLSTLLVAVTAIRTQSVALARATPG